ncbi:HsdM family class I SAM-dependent methyltransferase [Glutamicibacter sp. BSL13]
MQRPPTNKYADNLTTGVSRLPKTSRCGKPKVIFRPRGWVRALCVPYRAGGGLATGSREAAGREILGKGRFYNTGKPYREPPFGVDWKKQEKAVREEHAEKGFAGRFGPGLPRVSDGSMLFLLHLISKMREPAQGSTGGRAAIVLNGSPLFTGGAGSGESNIRKWIMERDYLEAIIALPTDMFYNTGISTYIWVLSKEKSPKRRNKVQLVDGSKLFRKMRKGLGSKRNELGPEDIQAIVKLYGDFAETNQSKIFDTTDFFYRTITIERPLKLNFATTVDRIDAALPAKAFGKLTPEAMAGLRNTLESMDDTVLLKNRDEFTKILKNQLKTGGVELSAPQFKTLVAGLSERDDTADVCTGAKGKIEPDTDLRDTENVPWNEDIHTYVEREVKPFVPDAWIDEDKTKEGCEIPFTRHFYQYTPPRSLEEIDADLDAVLGRIRARLEQVKA